MNRIRMFLFFGIWVTILPYLGFPYGLKNLLTSISGVGLIFVSFILFKEHYHIIKNKKENNKNYDNFSENELSEDNSFK